MTAPTTSHGVYDPWTTTNAVMYDVLETVPDLQPGLIAVQTYAQMRRDPRLAAILAGYTLQVRRASWQVEPGGCRPEVVQQVADDLGLPIAGEDVAGAARTRGVSWHEHLRSALLSLTYGHMTFELLAKVDDDGAHLVGLSERMPWTLSLIHSDPKTGALLGVTQTAGAKDADTPQMKADRLAHYCHDRENTWYGTSLLRSSYAPWFLKHELMRVHATSARRFGMGVPTVEWANGSNPTPAQISEAQRFASAARVGDQSGASLPPGASLVLRGLSGGVPDVLGYIKYLDQQMAGAALMPHIDLGNTESGSRAVASTFLDSWTLSLGAIAEEIADVSTRQVAARVVGWNWGEDEPVPRIVVSGVGTQREATAESLQLLLSAGALSAEPALEAWVRKEYRLPEAAPAPVAVPGATLPGQTAPGTPLPDGTVAPVPATAASTDDGLIAAALAAANARNWGALDEAVEQMATRETAAPAPTDLPAHWAEVADDAGQDWRVDAALARGADIPSAVSSVFGTDDSNAIARAYDIWTADQQVAPGGSAPLTLEDFTALVAAAPRPALTLDIDNRIVALAVRLGRFSALLAQDVSTCPYPAADAESTALRRVWLASYLRIRPPADAAPADAPADATKTEPPATTPPAKKVTAAAGHPSKCATAKLGSVCHCECGGVRHGWAGTMPSGVKSNLSGLSGEKSPRSGLDGLNGDKPPAPSTVEPTPAPAPPPSPVQESTPVTPAPAAPEPVPAPSAPPPAPEAPPAPAAPAADTRSYDERVAEALTEVEARTSPPLSRYRSDTRELTDDERDVVEEYMADGFAPINHMLRGGDAAELPQWDRRDRGFDLTPEVIDGWTATIDSLMAESPLPQSIIAWRGMRNGDTLFSDAFSDDLTGVEWRDDAYSSTSTDEEISTDFALDELGNALPGSTLMHVLVPSGIGALELSDQNYESEVLLNRGLRFRVVTDYGIGENGVRVLDVEVVPDGG